MIADQLIQWMRRPLPEVPTGAPLCVSCSVRPAITDDGDLTACWPCILRAGDRARRPIRFDNVELAALERAHQDVTYTVACQVHRIDWSWTRSWPGAGDLALLAPASALRALGEAYKLAVVHRAMRGESTMTVHLISILSARTPEQVQREHEVAKALEAAHALQARLELLCDHQDDVRGIVVLRDRLASEIVDGR